MDARNTGVRFSNTLLLWSGREDCLCPDLLTHCVLETASCPCLPSLHSQHSGDRVLEGNQATLSFGPSSCLGVASYNTDAEKDLNFRSTICVCVCVCVCCVYAEKVFVIHLKFNFHWKDVFWIAIFGNPVLVQY